MVRQYSETQGETQETNEVNDSEVDDESVIENTTDGNEKGDLRVPLKEERTKTNHYHDQLDPQRMGIHF